MLRILSDRVQPAYELLLLRLPEQAVGIDVILYPVELLFGSHGEEPVDGDSEKHGDPGDQLYVRNAVAAFPLADGLRRHVQRGGQRLLRKPPIGSEAADLFSHFHNGILPVFSALS